MMTHEIGKVECSYHR